MTPEHQLKDLKPFFDSLDIHPIWRLMSALDASWRGVAESIGVTMSCVTQWRWGHKKTPMLVSLWLAYHAERKLLQLETLLAVDTTTDDAVFDRSPLLGRASLARKVSYARDLLDVVAQQNALDCTGRQAQEWSAYLASQDGKDMPTHLDQTLGMVKAFRKRQTRNRINSHKNKESNTL